MTDQVDEFRNTAAQCLALAQITTDLHTRAALMLIAQRLHDLATNRPPPDLDAASDEFHAAPRSPQPVTLQQQQEQPKNKEEE